MFIIAMLSCVPSAYGCLHYFNSCHFFLSDPKTGTKKLDSVIGSTERRACEEQRLVPASDNTSFIPQLVITVPEKDARVQPTLENSKTIELKKRIQQNIVNKLLAKAKTMAVTKRNSVAATSIVDERYNGTPVKLEPNEILEHVPDAFPFPDVSNKFNHNIPNRSKRNESNSQLLGSPQTPKLHFVFQDVCTKTSRTVTVTDPGVSGVCNEVVVETLSGRSQKVTPLNASCKPSILTEKVRILVVRLHKLSEGDITARFCCDHDLGLLNGVEILMGLRQLEMTGANSRNEDRILDDEESQQLEGEFS